MGRANGRTNLATSVSSRRNPIEEQLGSGVSLDEIYIELAEADIDQPDWRTPGDFLIQEAKQFIRPGRPDGIELDQAVATRLLKPEFVGHEFDVFKTWYEPTRESIVPPEETCAGMNDAGKMLSKAITDGETIAVYCDYDVDGTTAGEIFRRGVEPYDAKLHYGYADAQQGFGLTNDFVNEAHKAGAKVLITLDCGSSQSTQVALAQKLGMKVVVVDHHNIADNPADFHLNPKLSEVPSSDNTGSQLSWKLVCALQADRAGKSRPEHWEEGMHLAGMGTLADMGSVMNHENRAFFWLANDHAVPGVKSLAEALGEDPTTPGQMVLTQAALNLPKRTSKVDASDVGKLFAAKTAEEAAPMVKKLLSSYEAAKPQKDAMFKESISQTGEKSEDDKGETVRSQPDKYFASPVLDGFSEYAGYTGPVANTVSAKTGKPAVIFAKKEDGSYKFSARNSVGARGQLGELIDDPAMREACTMKKENESGEIVDQFVIGGHAALVSGSCYEDQVPKVIEAMEAWAAVKDKENKGFFRTKWTGADAFLTERKVDPERLSKIEAEARKLGPFTTQKQDLYQARDGLGERKASNDSLHISVEGKLSELNPDPENENWLVGELQLAGSDEKREIRFPAEIENPPIGKKCEWIIRVGQSGPYYLRKFHKPKRRSRPVAG